MLFLPYFYNKVPHALFLTFIIYQVPRVLILHKTANVLGLYPAKLKIYDQKDVEFFSLKPSWILNHETISRNGNKSSQSTADQTNLRHCKINKYTGAVKYYIISKYTEKLG